MTLNVPMAAAMTLSLQSRNALASALVCTTALAVERYAPPLVCALVLAVVMLGLRFVLPGVITPNGVLRGVLRDQPSHGEAVTAIVCQFAGAAFAGLLVGCVVQTPASMPEAWSWETALELVAACALTLAARSSERTRGWRSSVAVAAVVALSALVGARFLGSPALLLAAAFQDVATGIIPSIGAALAAQALGVMVGLALASWLRFDAKPPREPVA